MVSTAFLSPSGSSDAQSHLHIVSESYGENASEGILMKQAHDNTVGDPTKKKCNVDFQLYLFRTSCATFLLFPIPLYSCF